MPTLTELENKYLSFEQTGSNRLYRGARSHLEPIIDGENYFDRLQKLIEQTKGGGDAIYIMGWAFTSADFKLQKTKPKLAQILAEKAAAGVDVRMVFWAEWNISSIYEFHPVNRLIVPMARGILIPTMNAAVEMRLTKVSGSQDLPLEKRILLDASGPKDSLIEAALDSGDDRVAAHFSSHHQKSVLIIAPDQADPSKKTMVGFVGGMDLCDYIEANRRHDKGRWHDVAVEVRGEAAKGVHENFRTRWEEALNAGTDALGMNYVVYKKTATAPWVARNPFVPDGAPLTPPSTNFSIPDVTGNNGQVLPEARDNTVQIVQTFPKHPDWQDSSLRAGRDTVLKTLTKALNAAERYVYIESQYFGWQEAFHLPTTAEPTRLLVSLLQKPDIKIILVGGWEADYGSIPNDLKKPEFKDRVAFWKLDGNNPNTGDPGVFMHSKSILIDDRFAIIGSANFSDRSLKSDHRYGTDSEICAALVTTGNWVRDLRVDLWNEHLGYTFTGPVIESELQDLGISLGVWRTAWRTTSAVELPSAEEIHRTALAHSTTPDAFWHKLYYMGEPGTTP